MVNNNHTDEKFLLLRLKNSDERAFEILYNNYKVRIAGNLFKLLKSDDLVKEILQELFVKIWEVRTQIDPEKSFKSYLFRIAENLVHDYFRKVAKDKRLLNKIVASSSELYLHIEEDMLTKEDAQKLHEAINLMPPQRKMVFTLCKLEGKSYKEVEEIMGINVKTISSHMLQANRFLRTYFRDSSALTISVVLGVLFKGL
ncbi:sigma-70 family RNA polymerase sigma factor [Sphingobacterium alkalisoli]|uniref:Sigma-70 family RNA polymerase sigma factor n=1 Tax=Sphingobacterium alkalisoli TaxID=1874115 RepID=A0A4U0GNE0_9SPHI|nr:sigma-70 family RNA polymerase sigma factor [Sphingobacterium alkalisoli]TJY60086.1 sigma-70 family RNA polymerase sigma factor [Sphingobacterium alkalisoli]GGH32808.1 DNA-directed RNA polymerase sigma-70 factor [Sphingobacterium alkalisoli]